MHIGLFFGSFNPLHIGHLAIAGHMAQFTELEQVWFVVSPHNPLKEKKSLLKGHHRLAMIQQAIDKMPYLKGSDVEFKLPQPSFTVNTLVVLEEKYPQHTFSIIMGMDNLESLHKWKNYEVLLERYRIFVYPRVGHTPGEFAGHSSVNIIEDVPLMEISSTFIRKAIAKDIDVRFLMPDAAYDYMQEMRFYKS
jgi:nicotinate-nucleotide adenylyltransferase